MGKLIYGGTDIDIDDRLLTHLQAVIIAKLRRDEAVTLSWVVASEHGGRQHSIWVSPSIPLQFKFYGNRQPALNREWLEQLMRSANSSGGLHFLPEPERPLLTE